MLNRGKISKTPVLEFGLQVAVHGWSLPGISYTTIPLGLHYTAGDGAWVSCVTLASFEVVVNGKPVNI
jgi:hypothetical protein